MMSANIDEIPKPLIKLIRLIMRSFYNVEHKIVVDMLVRKRETKEDDLIEALKLERKHLKALITHLRQDKFVNLRSIMETDEEQKSTRQNYYSINYRMFVNVVKYKIDQARRRLETSERDTTSRAKFRCLSKSCGKAYTDFEVNQIFDMESGLMKCNYCYGIVDEEPNAGPTVDSRAIVAEFNRQMNPIYELLKETEEIDWSLFEADRNNMTSKANGSNPLSGSMTNGTPLLSNPTKAAGSMNGSFPSDQQPIVGSVGAYANVQDQYPVRIIGLEDKHTLNKDMDSVKPSTINILPEVEAMLLREENSDNAMNIVQENLDEDMNGNCYSAHSTLTIPAGKMMVPIDRISDEHVELMTQQQRDEYKRTMQLIYNFIYG